MIRRVEQQQVGYRGSRTKKLGGLEIPFRIRNTAHTCKGGGGGGNTIITIQSGVFLTTQCEVEA